MYPSWEGLRERLRIVFGVLAGTSQGRRLLEQFAFSSVVHENHWSEIEPDLFENATRAAFRNNLSGALRSVFILATLELSPKPISLQRYRLSRTFWIKFFEALEDILSDEEFLDLFINALESRYSASHLDQLSQEILEEEFTSAFKRYNYIIQGRGLAPA